MENIRERAARALGMEKDLWFDPEHDPRHAAMLEAEVAKRELRHRYVAELWKMVFAGETSDYIDISGFAMDLPDYLHNEDWDIEIMWKFITATPAQRTEAAVLTIEAVERKES